MHVTIQNFARGYEPEPEPPCWGRATAPISKPNPSRFARVSIVHQCLLAVDATAGVQQGSVYLDQSTLYVSDVIALIDEWLFCACLSYADDLHVYSHADPTQSAQLLAHMADYVTQCHVKMCMDDQETALSQPSKTELIWLCSPAVCHSAQRQYQVVRGS